MLHHIEAREGILGIADRPGCWSRRDGLAAADYEGAE